MILVTSKFNLFNNSLHGFRLFLILRAGGRKHKPVRTQTGLMRKTSIEEFEKMEENFLVLGRQLTLKDFDRRKI